ncbi:MAG: hypothetical protein AWT59_0267 [Candidatus Gallionella acididurans]|uniref:Lipoprotein n=1 Tax=Candidatus Gallionella acididurans TaxID=1796491 RepID=A0A139BX28_9PROT|nr:MAG: hypothetical protein AWT59_0267 [Candidatus Gallionella acididurans]
MFDSNIPAKLMAVTAILMLQGCGHKAPLMLSPSQLAASQAAAAQAAASQAAASQVSATSQPVPDAQNPGTPAKQP